MIIKDLINTVRALIRIADGDRGKGRVILRISICGRLNESFWPR